MIKLISSKTDGDFFWIKMGKFFASKEIRKEFNNYPLNDSYQHVWFTYFINEEVIAFVGLSLEKIKKNEVIITEMYTIPEHRNKGIAKLLYQEAIKYIKTLDNIKYVKVCVNPNAYTHSIFKDFDVESMRGAYTYYSKEITLI